MSYSNNRRGRGGILPNIRRRGAFFSNQGTVSFPGAPQPSTTAASASSTSGEGASEFASSSTRPSSSSGPLGLTSRPGSSSGQMGPPFRPSSSGQMGPPSRPSSSPGPMGPPPHPSSSSGPGRHPFITSLDCMEFYDPLAPTRSGARFGPPRSGLSAPSPVSYGTDPPSAPSPVSYGTGSSSAPSPAPYSTGPSSAPSPVSYGTGPSSAPSPVSYSTGSPSAPFPVSYGTVPPSAPSTYGLIDSNARPRYPNLPAPAPVAPSPLTFRVPTDAISRFMELKQSMNRLQKATQDCDTLATNPFAHHLNVMQVDYSEEFKLELAGFEEACSLLIQLIRREREVMDMLAQTVLPRTMRLLMAVRQEVFRLKTSPSTTLDSAVDSLMAVFRGLDQMFGGRDVMTEEWVALKDKWLSQGPLFL